MTWLQTRDCRVVDLLNPDLAAVSIEEIAHSLARINRFTGHTRTVDGYSVAQHSVEVSWIVPPEFALHGLLHDAHEAFTGDISRPMKRAIEALGGQGIIKTIEGCLDDQIAKRFGICWTPQADAAVKSADNIALLTEQRDLLGPQAMPWRVEAEPLERVLMPASAWLAQRQFLARFYDLMCAREIAS